MIIDHAIAARICACLWGVMVACALGSGSIASAQSETPAPLGLENVGVDEHLEAQMPLDTRFRDHTGRVV